MSEISHQQAKNLIQATRGGSITELEKENLALHLGNCAACRGYASQMDALEGSLRRGFHTRWDPIRGPSPRAVETIYIKTRANLMVKKIFGFASAAIAVGILAIVAIFATSIRPIKSVPLTGGQPIPTQTPILIPTQAPTLIPTQAPTLIPTPTPAVTISALRLGEYVWAPPAYGQADPESAGQMLGPGVCQNPVSSFMGTGTFKWPTKRHTISGYDYSPEIQHFGIDLASSSGDPVVAADGGVVVYAGWNNFGYGNIVVIDHGTGKQSLYAHLSSVDVACGEHLEQGHPIGKIGSTGNATGPQLHFEIIVDNKQVSPHPYLPAP